MIPRGTVIKCPNSKCGRELYTNTEDIDTSQGAFLCGWKWKSIDSEIQDPEAEDEAKCPICGAEYAKTGTYLHGPTIIRELSTTKGILRL